MSNSLILNEEYRKLLRNKLQPRRKLAKVKKIAIGVLQDYKLQRKVKVKVTRTISNPFARAEYIRKGNVMKLHPINRFADIDDLYGTVEHEITRYRDEIRKTSRAKEY